MDSSSPRNFKCLREFWEGQRVPSSGQQRARLETDYLKVTAVASEVLRSGQAHGLAPGRGSAELEGQGRWALGTGVKWGSCADSPLKADCSGYKLLFPEICPKFSRHPEFRCREATR